MPYLTQIEWDNKLQELQNEIDALREEVKKLKEKDCSIIIASETCNNDDTK